ETEARTKASAVLAFMAASPGKILFSAAASKLHPRSAATPTDAPIRLAPLADAREGSWLSSRREFGKGGAGAAGAAIGRRIPIHIVELRDAQRRVFKPKISCDSRCGRAQSAAHPRVR